MEHENQASGYRGFHNLTKPIGHPAWRVSRTENRIWNRAYGVLAVIALVEAAYRVFHG